MKKFGFVVGLIAIAAVSTGCGKRTVFNAQPSEAVAQDREEPALKAEPLELSAVSIAETMVSASKPARVAESLIERDLILRSEQYTNHTKRTIWIWIKPQGGEFHFWSLCTEDRAQYEAYSSAPSLRLRGGKLHSQDLPMGDWGAFELTAGETATVEWVAGGKWSWIPGPYLRPAQSCSETAPDRGFAGFEIEGSLQEDVRISLPDVSVPDATGERSFLDSTRVIAEPLVEQSLHQHWGDGR